MSGNWVFFLAAALVCSGCGCDKPSRKRQSAAESQQEANQQDSAGASDSEPAATGGDAPAPRKLHEPEGGFSFTPPKDWEVSRFPGLKYRICSGPAEGGFAPNINVLDELSSDTLAGYVDVFLDEVRKAIPGLKILDREDFKTIDREPGVRVVYESRQQGRRLRHNAFLLGTPEWKYIVTTTTLADGGIKLDNTFFSAAKTFRFHPRQGTGVPAGPGKRDTRSPRKLHEEDGGYSFNPPAGWNVTSVPGLQYRICSGPAEGGFAPNINVVEELSSASLDDYVTGNFRLMKQMPGFNLIGREEFQTKDEKTGVKLLFQSTQQGRRLRQTTFFLGNGSRKYVVTCTALAAGGAELDPLFLESISTFRFH